MGRVYLSKIKRLTWLDWIKIIVAIDITSVGIGLIFGFNFHVFAMMFSWFSQFVFGILYILIAFLIILRTLYTKKVILMGKREDEDVQHSFLLRDTKILSRLWKLIIFHVKKVYRFLDYCSKKILDRIDDLLDYVEHFFKKRKDEVKKEIKDAILKDE